MTFIKSLKIKFTEEGQSTLEYFILFTVVATVMAWAFGVGYSNNDNPPPLLKIKAVLQGSVFQKVVGPEGLNLENK